MKDRDVQYPNRYKMTPVAGTTDTFDVEAVPGIIKAAGDDLNKATLLDDDTCALLSLSTDAVPNNALQKIVLGSKYAFAVTVKTPLGKAIPGVTVTGLTSLSGGSAITDGNGYVLGTSTAASVTLSITSPYLDLNNWSSTVSAGSSTVTRITANLTAKATKEITYTSSISNIKFSPDINQLDFCLVGGGGGGSRGSVCGGGGGGGGFVSNALNVTSVYTDVFNITVGAGGAAGVGGSTTSTSNGGSGGSSSVVKNGTSIGTANGGSGGYCQYPDSPSGQNRNYGGSGNGGGGDGAYGGFAGAYTAAVAGGASTTYKFGVSSLGVAGGGAGGGGGNYTGWGQYPSGAAGGSPNGGAGGYGETNGTSATAAGGGGGGGGSSMSGGSGYAGCVSVRWRSV